MGIKITKSSGRSYYQKDFTFTQSFFIAKNKAEIVFFTYI